MATSLVILTTFVVGVAFCTLLAAVEVKYIGLASRSIIFSSLLSGVLFEWITRAKILSHHPRSSLYEIKLKTLSLRAGLFALLLYSSSISHLLNDRNTSIFLLTIYSFFPF